MVWCPHLPIITTLSLSRKSHIYRQNLSFDHAVWIKNDSKCVIWLLAVQFEGPSEFKWLLWQNWRTVPVCGEIPKFYIYIFSSCRLPKEYRRRIDFVYLENSWNAKILTMTVSSFQNCSSGSQKGREVKFVGHTNCRQASTCRDWEENTSCG